jgi:hypothetical protein
MWAYLEKLGVAKQLIHVCKKLYKRFAMDVEGIFSFLSTTSRSATRRLARTRVLPVHNPMRHIHLQQYCAHDRHNHVNDIR